MQSRDYYSAPCTHLRGKGHCHRKSLHELRVKEEISHQRIHPSQFKNNCDEFRSLCVTFGFNAPAPYALSRCQTVEEARCACLVGPQPRRACELLTSERNRKKGKPCEREFLRPPFNMNTVVVRHSSSEMWKILPRC